MLNAQHPLQPGLPRCGRHLVSGEGAGGKSYRRRPEAFSLIVGIARSYVGVVISLVTVLVFGVGCPVLGPESELPPIVGEGAIGIGHLVGVFTLLDRGTPVV